MNGLITMSLRNFKLYRGNDSDGQLVDYQIKVDQGMVVLDVIHRIQAKEANDLAVRWNCKAGKCGSCSVEINGKPLGMKKKYKVGTQSFLAQGGDLYDTFLESEYQDRKVNFSEEIIDYLRINNEIKEPKKGRLISQP